MNRVTLVGLDFGSTTSSMLAVSAGLAVHSVSGRRQFKDCRVVFRPPAVFTPFAGGRLCLDQIDDLLDTWLRQCGDHCTDVFSGGAIITGLAARQENALELRRRVSARIGDSLIATADDPRLESWLSFMGSVSGLSHAHPDLWFINLDIGGGTTNAALGRGGHVMSTGCAYIGARHIQFAPGSYRITALSDFGEALLNEIGASVQVGDELNAEHRARVLDVYVHGLEALVAGDATYYGTPARRAMLQAEFAIPPGLDPIITFSGGVGELIYSAASGEPLPSTTSYGDLGIDFAAAILRSPRLSRDVVEYAPENLGRATVQGLTLHSMEISGATLFLPEYVPLPLRDLPVVATLQLTASEAEIAAVCDLASGAAGGACIQLTASDRAPGPAIVRRFGLALKAQIERLQPLSMPLVVLTTANIGNALGNYATGWGQTGQKLVIIDEIPMRQAQFVNIGSPRHGIVPVTLYGMR